MQKFSFFSPKISFFCQNSSIIQRTLTNYSSNWPYYNYPSPCINISHKSCLKPKIIQENSKNKNPKTAYFRLNFCLFGLHSFWFHLTNIILHSITSTLFVRTCLEVARLEAPFATVAGLLFAVHPVHTEAVSFPNTFIALKQNRNKTSKKTQKAILNF